MAKIPGTSIDVSELTYEERISAAQRVLPLVQSAGAPWMNEDGTIDDDYMETKFGKDDIRFLVKDLVNNSPLFNVRHHLLAGETAPWEVLVTEHRVKHAARPAVKDIADVLAEFEGVAVHDEDVGVVEGKRLDVDVELFFPATTWVDVMLEQAAVPTDEPIYKGDAPAVGVADSEPGVSDPDIPIPGSVSATWVEPVRAVHARPKVYEAFEDWGPHLAGQYFRSGCGLSITSGVWHRSVKTAKDLNRTLGINDGELVVLEDKARCLFPRKLLVATPRGFFVACVSIAIDHCSAGTAWEMFKTRMVKCPFFSDDMPDGTLHNTLADMAFLKMHTLDQRRARAYSLYGNRTARWIARGPVPMPKPDEAQSHGVTVLGIFVGSSAARVSRAAALDGVHVALTTLVHASGHMFWAGQSETAVFSECNGYHNRCHVFAWGPGTHVWTAPLSRVKSTPRWYFSDWHHKKAVITSPGRAKGHIGLEMRGMNAPRVDQPAYADRCASIPPRLLGEKGSLIIRSPVRKDCSRIGKGSVVYVLRHRKPCIYADSAHWTTIGLKTDSELFWQPESFVLVPPGAFPGHLGERLWCVSILKPYSGRLLQQIRLKERAGLKYLWRSHVLDKLV